MDCVFLCFVSARHSEKSLQNPPLIPKRQRGRDKVSGECTFGSSEMNDIPIFLEHVDLLDRLDGLDIEFLERGLKLLVIGARRLVDFLCLAARCAFASVVQ